MWLSSSPTKPYAVQEYVTVAVVIDMLEGCVSVSVHTCHCCYGESAAITMKACDFVPLASKCSLPEDGTGLVMLNSKRTMDVSTKN